MLLIWILISKNIVDDFKSSTDKRERFYDPMDPGLNVPNLRGQPPHAHEKITIQGVRNTNARPTSISKTSIHIFSNAIGNTIIIPLRSTDLPWMVERKILFETAE